MNCGTDIIIPDRDGWLSWFWFGGVYTAMRIIYFFYLGNYAFFYRMISKDILFRRYIV